MSRREDEQKALKIIGERIKKRPPSAVKRKVSGLAILSFCLWAAAISLIGTVVVYAYLTP